MLEPVWNRNHLECVQITLAEDFGVEDRGHFYDPVGALRDVVVNHLMQVVAAAAMEAPAGGDPETLKSAQREVFRAMRPADPRNYVRGQYDGYGSIEGVAEGSTTETYVALRLDIESWRWSGVPFFIRTGKRLPVTQTELRLVFKEPPTLGFGLRSPDTEPDQFVVKLDPSTGVRLVLNAHRADAPKPESIALDLEFAQAGGEGATPYEVLLHAAMIGQDLRFTPTGLRRGGVARNAAADRRPTGAPQLSTGLVGTRGGRLPGLRTRRLARAVGRMRRTCSRRERGRFSPGPCLRRSPRVPGRAGASSGTS